MNKTRLIYSEDDIRALTRALARGTFPCVCRLGGKKFAFRNAVELAVARSLIADTLAVRVFQEAQPPSQRHLISTK